MKSPDGLKAKQESGTKVEASPERQVEAMGREISAEAANLVSELEADARESSDEKAKSKLRGLSEEAGRAAEDFSNTVVEAKGEKRESMRETYEYRDAEGKLICTAEAEYGPLGPDDAKDFDANDLGTEKISGRLLKSLRLVGEKGEIDLVELAQASDIKIIVSDKRLGNYEFREKAEKPAESAGGYVEKSDRVLVPPLENLLDVGIALHELGHAAQYKDEAFSGIKDLYAVGKDPIGSVSLSRLDEIKAALPETRTLAPMLAELKSLREELEGKTAEIRDKKSEISSIESRLKKDVAKFMDRTLPFSQELKEVSYDSKPEARKALEKMGFMVSDVVAVAPKKMSGGGFTFGKSDRKGKSELPSLNEDDLSAGGLSVIETALFRSFPIEEAQIDYDPGARSLSLKLPAPFSYGTERKSVSLKVPYPPEDFAALQEIRNAASEKIGAVQAEISRLEEDVAAARKGLESIDASGEFKKLAKAPQRILERDATRRAFLWLRKVKQVTGADIFRQVKAEAAQLDILDNKKEGEGCEGSMAVEAAGAEIDGLVSAKDYLATAYGTYGATLGEMRINGPDQPGPGRMPLPPKKKG